MSKRKASEDIEGEDHPIFSFLHNKKYKGLPTILKILDDIHIINQYKSGILHYAVWSGNNDCIKFIIEKGGDPNIKNFIEETPLMWAVRRLDIDNIKYLLVNGADPTLKNYFNEDIFTMIGSWIMFPNPEKVENIKSLLYLCILKTTKV
jgi:ankyrin repeat protein